MSNLSLKGELIRAHSEFSAEKLEKISPKALIKKLTRERNKIKEKKSRLSRENEIWFVENHYFLERRAEELKKTNEPILSKLKYITDAFVKNTNEITSENISFLFEVLTRDDFADDKALDYVKDAIVYSLIYEVIKRCENGEDIGEKIALLHKVNSFDFYPFLLGFSKAERYLRCDPCGIWQKMTKESRRLYKTRIYKIFRR